MDAVEYANKLAKQFGVDQTAAMSMLEAEASDERENRFRGTNRPSYQRALDTAYERISEWLTRGDEYYVALNWVDLARFVCSHRRACVWAVLYSKGRAAAAAAGMADGDASTV